MRLFSTINYQQTPKNIQRLQIQQISQFQQQNTWTQQQSRQLIAFSQLAFSSSNKKTQGNKKQISKQQKKQMQNQKYQSPSPQYYENSQQQVSQQEYEEYMRMQQLRGGSEGQDGSQVQQEYEEDQEYVAKPPSDPVAAQEFKSFIQTLNLKSQSSFEIIEMILDYAQKARSQITETEVEMNFEFFLSLLEKLKQDLGQIIRNVNQFGDLTIEVEGKQFKSSISGEEGDNVASALQFSYAMAYDDKDLWFRMNQVILELIRVDSLKVIPILKILDIFNSFKDDEEADYMSAEQVNVLEQKLTSCLANQVEEFSVMSRIELITILKASLKFLPPSKHEEYYAKIDKLLGADVMAMNNVEFGALMGTITNFNLQADNEEEMIPEYIMMQGEEHATQNLPFYKKDELLGVMGAYCSTEMLDQLPELNKRFQDELLQRTSQYSSTDIAYIVKCYSMTKNSGTAEFYAALDKFIGNHLDYVDPQDIYPILKSFYDSGFARNKLFIKLQPQIINNLENIGVNELSALMRLYHEMDVEQITFYEEVAFHIESHLKSIDETGLVNALIVFKSIPTKRQLSVVTDLEQILMGNMKSLSASSVNALLYHYSSKFSAEESRKNNKITEALKLLAIRNIQKSHNSREQITPFDIIFLLQAFTKLNVEPEYISMVSEQIPHVVEQYQDGDLQMMLHMLADLQSKHEGFDRGFNAVQREVNSRKVVEEV
eukprot:403351500